MIPDHLREALRALGGPVVAVDLDGSDADDASFTFYGVLRHLGDPCLVEFPRVRDRPAEDPVLVDAVEEYALRASQAGAEGRCWFARARVKVLG
jgi:hypothetical protein